MKKIIYIITLFFCFSCTAVKAQNYLTHKVKAGETIGSIAQKYNLKKATIFKLNPDAKNGIKQNTVLIIPKLDNKAQEKVTNKTKEIDSYKKHKVKRKETLYGLSKKYNVTEAEIKKSNTFLYANNLQKGDKLKIPVFKTATVLKNKPLTTPYTVLPTEGFFRLKIKTGLTKTELQQLNPELLVSGLKEGMILKVPNGSVKAVSLNENSITETPINLTKLINDTSTKNIAIMLPFTLNTINTDSVLNTKQKIKNNPTLGKTLDFYTGVLMALDSLKKLGVNLKVDVYDTEKKLSSATSIARSISNTDVVIGPLLSKNFNSVASILATKNIPVVSPIVKNINIEKNVFQSRPNDAILKNKIINYFVADTSAQVVVISDLKRKTTSALLNKKFTKAIIVNSRLDKKTNEDEYYILEEDLLDVIKPGKNVVFLETDNKNFISNVSSMLNALQIEGTEIILTTTNANAAFEHEEVSNYHLSNLHFTFPSISKILNENSTNSFIKAYKKEYEIAPSTFAIRGFDLTLDVVLRIVTSEDMYKSATEASTTVYLENKFAYKKKNNGGYYNDSVYLVRYNDLKIEEIK